MSRLGHISGLLADVRIDLLGIDVGLPGCKNGPQMADAGCVNPLGGPEDEFLRIRLTKFGAARGRRSGRRAGRSVRDDIAYAGSNGPWPAIFDSPGAAWDGRGMSSTPTRNIALTPVLEGYIRAQVAPGHYSNASEVVRAGLRLLMERDLAAPRPTAPDAGRQA